MAITLYGIKNCDTVKKARDWLAAQQVDYHFHDFRSDGLTTAQVTLWINEIGLETLVNKRSTTWKELDEAAKASFNKHTAASMIVAHPTLIKRPLLDTGKEKFVGFNTSEYQHIFGRSD